MDEICVIPLLGEYQQLFHDQMLETIKTFPEFVSGGSTLDKYGFFPIQDHFTIQQAGGSDYWRMQSLLHSSIINIIWNKFLGKLDIKQKQCLAGGLSHPRSPGMI